MVSSEFANPSQTTEHPLHRTPTSGLESRGAVRLTQSCIVATPSVIRMDVKWFISLPTWLRNELSGFFSPPFKLCYQSPWIYLKPNICWLAVVNFQDPKSKHQQPLCLRKPIEERSSPNVVSLMGSYSLAIVGSGSFLSTICWRGDSKYM